MGENDEIVTKLHEIIAGRNIMKEELSQQIELRGLGLTRLQSYITLALGVTTSKGNRIKVSR